MVISWSISRRFFILHVERFYLFIFWGIGWLLIFRKVEKEGFFFSVFEGKGDCWFTGIDFKKWRFNVNVISSLLHFRYGSGNVLLFIFSSSKDARLIGYNCWFFERWRSDLFCFMELKM